MPTFLKVETFHQQHPELMVREHKRAVVAGHYAGGRLWAEQLLGEHFEAGARSEFAYFERKEKYRRTKVKLARLGKVEDGGRRDLVFSGLTRRMTRLARNLIVATPREVKISVPTPRYIQMRPNRYARHGLGLEILAVSPRHEKLVAAATGRGFDRELRQIRAAKRTVIRS